MNDWSEYDFHIYGRQSDESSHGNESTKIQEKNLPDAVVDHFHLDPAIDSGRIFQYDVEILSGTDTDITVDFGEQRTDDIIVGFPRAELMELFRTMMRRYQAAGRKSVLAVYKLNRLARSGDFTFFLNQIVRTTGGGVRIWSMKEGLLDPGTPEGRLMLEIHCGMTGGGESKTKSDFVRDAHRNIALTQPTRSLGERTLGYRIEERIRKGGRKDKKEYHHVADNSPHASLNGNSQVDMVRLIFDMTKDGNLPAQIATELNLRGWKHPHTEKPFTVSVIKAVLNNTMYVGRQTRMTYRTRHVGSRKKIRDISKRVESPYEESLRIVDDVTFEQVRNIMEARRNKRPGRPTRSAGRPHKEMRYFSGGTLRCAGCGSAMSYNGHKKGRSEYCCTRSNTGQPRCQSHRVRDLDAAIDNYFLAAFKEFPAYVERLRKDLAEETSAKERGRLSRELAKKRGMLREMEDSLFDPEFTVDAKVQIRQRYNELAKEVSDLAQRLDSFGATEDVKHKRAHIARATALAAYEKLNRMERKAIISQYVERVWVWPDGYFHVERKGNPLDTSTRPLYVGAEEHELLYALDWPQIDFEKVRSELLRIWDSGWLDKGDFFPFCSRVVVQRCVDGRFASAKLHTLLRLYYAALQNAVDMPRLLGDMANQVDTVVREDGWNAAKERWGFSVGLLNKIRQNNYQIKYAALQTAEQMGFDLSEYRPDLSSFYLPDYLDHMIFWWDANEGMAIGARLEAEMETRRKAGRGLRSYGYTPLPAWYEGSQDSDASAINGVLAKPQCINQQAMTNYEYDDFRALIGV